MPIQIACFISASVLTKKRGTVIAEQLRRMAAATADPDQTSALFFSDSEDWSCSSCFHHVLCINKIKSNQAENKASAPTPFERPKGKRNIISCRFIN
jgi:hypothetical protein